MFAQDFLFGKCEEICDCCCKAMSFLARFIISRTHGHVERSETSVFFLQNTAPWTLWLDKLTNRGSGTAGNGRFFFKKRFFAVLRMTFCVKEVGWRLFLSRFILIANHTDTEALEVPSFLCKAMSVFLRFICMANHTGTEALEVPSFLCKTPRPSTLREPF